METIYYCTKASDGTVFKGINFNQLESEVNAYELKLSQKKIKRQERLRKMEEERKTEEEKYREETKVKEDKKKYILLQIADYTNNINRLCDEYKDVFPSGHIYFWLANDKLMCDAADTKTSDLAKFF